MGRALVLLLVAIAAGALVYLVAAPRFLSPRNASTPAPAASLDSPAQRAGQRKELDVSAPVPASPTLPIASPRTPQQREFEHLEMQRAPFYARLHREHGTLIIEAHPAETDQGTLDLYAAQSGVQTVPQLLARAVQPEAYQYGFRHVRFFLPNPSGDVERYRCDAEANADSNGVWHTFQK